MNAVITPRAAALIVSLSAAFFTITATTFASLGVVLPAMIAEFDWNWATAGLGFTALALMTGVFSPVAATSLERLSARRHYLLGAIVATSGYVALGAAHSVAAYLAATSFLGAAFALLANVPGTFLVGRAVPVKWRNVSIGAYLAAGGAGGVIGPLAANAHISAGSDWRTYWFAAAVIVGALAALIAFLAKDTPADTHRAVPDKTSTTEQPERGWNAGRAMKTPAFIIISAALTVAYFCGVTVSTWSVAHLQNAGLAPAFAVSMFSLYSGLNAAARATGGALARYVAAKKLLVAALLANVIGMTSLAYATSPVLAISFAIFDGFAFGMALFATTALIIDYYGLQNSPALLGGANLAATIAMLGPTIAGYAADRSGDFSMIFLIYAAGALIAAFAVAMMRNPNK